MFLSSDDDGDGESSSAPRPFATTPAAVSRPPPDLPPDPQAVERVLRGDHVPTPDYSETIGAALLLFCRCPRTGIVFFLLGRERAMPVWHGSNLWSHFGGTRHKSETPEECAAREFVEETMGCVRFFGATDPLPLDPRADVERIARALAQGHYAYKYVHTQHGAPRYVVFVVHVPWDPDCVLRFRRIRSVLLTPNSSYTCLSPAGQSELLAHPAVYCETVRLAAALDAPTTRWIGVRNSFLEKRCIGLWSVEQVRAMVRGGSSTLRPPDVRYGSQACAPGLWEVFDRLLQHHDFHVDDAAARAPPPDTLSLPTQRPPHLQQLRSRHSFAAAAAFHGGARISTCPVERVVTDRPSET